MKACFVTVTTTIDGRETTVSKAGKMSIEPLCIQVQYQEENALVCIRAKGQTLTVDRKGDYTLHLSFEEGKKLVGSLGIGGQLGEVQTYTHKLCYSTSENGWLLCLHYDLWVGEEPQSTKIRLLSKAL